MKRNTFIMDSHKPSNGGEISHLKVKRAASPESSSAPMKRLKFSSEGGSPDSWAGSPVPSSGSVIGDVSERAVLFDSNRVQKSRAESPEHSCISMKSSNSMFDPPNFSTGKPGIDPRLQNSTAKFPEPSCVSMKSDNSMFDPPNFSTGGTDGDPRVQKLRAESPEPSCISLRSNNSMFDPPNFSTGGTGIDPREGRDAVLERQSRCGVCQQLTGLASFSCGHYCCRQCIKSYVDKLCLAGDFACPQCRKRSETHPGLTHMEKFMKQDTFHQADDVVKRVLERHKTSMRSKYESLFEGIKTQDNKTLLNRIYTQLYIIEGESEGVNEEHEVLLMENTLNKQLHDIPINCVRIFKPSNSPKTEMEEQSIRALMAKTAGPEERKEDEGPTVQKLRTVLTKGIAGIGKTVSVQKFILDWAEGKENQDIDFMFVLPFRELNLINGQFSLHRLLCDFHAEVKELDPKTYDVRKAVFIFDGLDESRIPLNFSECEKVSDTTKTSSVGALITNLIKGELLPSAHIWITSRPAAANQIPPQYINRVTEIQGFDDPQKEEYFRKRISDQDQAKKIISHIKTAKSLHIMCHIPVFCWISATVLQRVMKQSKKTEIPKTLTEMYSHFLLTQTNVTSEKYDGKDDREPAKLLETNREMILKLSELAFKQLMKGNVMFYEEDLTECGIDVTVASVNSGICTQIFKEESVLYQRKVYCFVHLSCQEFLAAFYTFYCYVTKNMEVLHFFKPQNAKWSKNVPLLEILTSTVHKALESENGHLDLFLRFLLGISLGSNQKLLRDLLKYQTRSSDSISKTVQHIKQLIQSKDLPAERSINLFLCLTEMKDQSLSQEIQEYLKSQKYSENKLSTAHCSAIAYMLLSSEEVLDELDLKKYNTSEKGYTRLIPAVSNCRKALLADCNLTINQCESLCSSLKSSSCSLKELDLSNNCLKDSFAELLLAGLKTAKSSLEIIRLALCNIGVKTCETLGSVLKLEKSSLKELDLSNNDLQDSGVDLLSAGLKTVYCKLQILRLSGCMITEVGCSSLGLALSSNPSHLKELDLTYNHPGDSGMNLLSARLEDPHCSLNTLRLEHGGTSRIKPGLNKYSCELTLDPNTAHPLLSLRNRGKKVLCMRKKQSYPDHPERFEHCEQVLCRESVTGRCYWEAEWSEGADIALTYKSINRKGQNDDCLFGFNENSWKLNCSSNGYSVCHNKCSTDIRGRPSNRVGVYVDCLGGTLSFYRVFSDTLTQLHTFHTTFSETLYAGFGVGVWNSDSSVYICTME